MVLVWLFGMQCVESLLWALCRHQTRAASGAAPCIVLRQVMSPAPAVAKSKARAGAAAAAAAGPSRFAGGAGAGRAAVVAGASPSPSAKVAFGRTVSSSPAAAAPQQKKAAVKRKPRGERVMCVAAVQT